MNCESCKNEHNGSYGSGRFCNVKCARGFSTKDKRKEISTAVSKKMKLKVAVGTHKTPFGQDWVQNLANQGIKDKQNKAEENISFEHLSEAHRKKILNRDQKGCCLECGISEWQNKPIVLHYDHKNGKRHDNSRENSRLLCPNCHSQTPTYCGNNKNNSGRGVSDSILLDALKKHKNIRQALKAVGLAGKGGNYERAYKLMEINRL